MCLDCKGGDCRRRTAYEISNIFINICKHTYIILVNCYAKFKIADFKLIIMNAAGVGISGYHWGLFWSFQILFIFVQKPPTLIIPPTFATTCRTVFKRGYAFDHL